MRSLVFTGWVRGKIIPLFGSSNEWNRKIMGFPRSNEVCTGCCTKLPAEMRCVQLAVRSSFASGKGVQLAGRGSRVLGRSIKVAVRSSFQSGRCIFVDPDTSCNPGFVHFLARAFPDQRVVGICLVAELRGGGAGGFFAGRAPVEAGRGAAVCSGLPVSRILPAGVSGR